VADVTNHTAEKSLGDKPPLEVFTGETIDTSILLCFLFWDVVFLERYQDSTYYGQPGSVKSSEIRGRFVGFAWSVGLALTFKILTDDPRGSFIVRDYVLQRKWKTTSSLISRLVLLYPIQAQRIGPTHHD
jgi:hypothetical protein